MTEHSDCNKGTIKTKLVFTNALLITATGAVSDAQGQRIAISLSILMICRIMLKNHQTTTTKVWGGLLAFARGMATCKACLIRHRHSQVPEILNAK